MATTYPCRQLRSSSFATRWKYCHADTTVPRQDVNSSFSPCVCHPARLRCLHTCPIEIQFSQCALVVVFYFLKALFRDFVWLFVKLYDAARDTCLQPCILFSTRFYLVSFMTRKVWRYCGLDFPHDLGFRGGNCNGLLSKTGLFLSTGNIYIFLVQRQFSPLVLSRFSRVWRQRFAIEVADLCCSSPVSSNFDHWRSTS